MKILILKPSSLGDVVQALPVLRLLKAHQPESEIYWWLSADLADLLRGDPDLSGILLFQRQRWSWPRHWGEMAASLRQIRQHRFDWVIDLQGLARSGVVSWLAEAEFTIGVEDWREGAPALFDVAVKRPSPTTHAVDWYLAVLTALGIPVHRNFEWLPPRPETAARVRQKWPPGAVQWITLNPAARWPNKRWPVESYCEVVQMLSRQFDHLHFAVLGGTADAPLGEKICQVQPERCLDLTGATSLSEMIEWIRLSHVVVSNDTGPMHVAAALGKPVVSIFGPTDPRRTGPYGQEHRTLQSVLPCVPCLRPQCHLQQPLACLHDISPAVVCASIQQILSSPATIE